MCMCVNVKENVCMCVCECVCACVCVSVCVSVCVKESDRANKTAKEGSALEIIKIFCCESASKKGILIWQTKKRRQLMETETKP